MVSAADLPSSGNGPRSKRKQWKSIAKVLLGLLVVAVVSTTTIQWMRMDTDDSLRLVSSKTKSIHTSSPFDALVLEELVASHVVTTPSKSNAIPRPKLLLHVGPHKTATTTIQLAALKPRKMRACLKLDGYTTVHSHYLRTKKLSQSCSPLDNGECERKDIWNEYKKSWRVQARNSNASDMIVSSEAFDSFPHTSFVKHMFRELQNDWDVHVIVGYRTLFGWTQSRYNQFRRREMLRDFETSIEVLWKTFPEWYQTRSRDAWNDIDPLGVFEWYREIFGPDKVHVFEMRPRNDSRTIAERFLCDLIPDAMHACERTRELARKKKTKSYNEGLETWQEDLLVVQAWGEGILSDSRARDHGCRLKPRKECVKSLSQTLALQNKTVRDLPQTCLSAPNMDLLLERSVRAEQVMAQHPASRQQLELEFAKLVPKFCSVDSSKVLAEDSVWRSLFSSEQFWQNCTASVDN